MERIVRLVVVLAAFFAIVTGVWAFFAPGSFFAVAAPWPPYNRHFLHDSGAFGIGLGAALLAGLVVRDGLLVALSGFAVASVLHLVSHLIDSGLGGRATDPLALGVLAAAVVYALVIHRRHTLSRLQGSEDSCCVEQSSP